MIKEYIKMAIKNLTDNRLRAVFAVIGISVGISSVISIVSLGECSKAAITAEMCKMGFNGMNIKQKYEKMTTSNLLKIEDVIRIEDSISEIECAVPVYNSYAVVSEKNNSKQAFVRGVDEDFTNFFSSKVLYGRFINNNDVKIKRSVAVIDENLALRLFKRKNVVGRNINIGNEQKTLIVKIIGVVEVSNEIISNFFSEKIPAILYMPVSTVQLLENVDNIDYISLIIYDGEDEKIVINKITKLLERFHHVVDTFYIENVEEQKKQFDSILKIFTMALSAIAGISLIVGGIGIMNIMLITVSERTFEIGIRKALGAKKKNILIQFLFEAIFLTGFGGITGIILGAIVTYIITRFTGIPFIISLSSVVYIFSFSLVIGLIFGIYPANKASKMLPVDALRYE